MLPWLISLAASTSAVAEEAKAEAAASEARLFESAKYLASDELEGRGIGTRGLDLAADYIAAQFAEIGLTTELYEGTPFQTFNMSTGAKLGETNEVALVRTGDDAQSTERLELKLDDDFTPLALGGSGEFDLPLVFVGYGITGKEENYDDYEGIDVEGKAVIILRREPQQDNPHSVFNGLQHSQHAPFARKVSNAYEHGAAAVIFVTEEYDIRRRVDQRRKAWQSALDALAEAHAEFGQLEDPSLAEIEAYRQKVIELSERIRSQGERMAAEYDPVLKFEAAGGAESGRNFPILHMRRAVIDKMLSESLGTTLSEVEAAIDEGPTPHSRELPGWRIAGRVEVERNEVEVKNVIGILEGEGPLADETIVIGAHYDHLGYGGPGSFVPDKHEIHNGADDNASGTSTLLEVARRLATRPQRLPRRVVFIAFTGEERGLVGSAHYVANPYIPLEDTVAMLNMDMVGRLNDDKLIVHGTGTAPELDALVDELGADYRFVITKHASGTGPSDHTSFYMKKIPVLHFFTGTHRDYHRPSDTHEKLNVEGMRRVGEMVADIAVRLAEAPERPTYQETAHGRMADPGDGVRPYFGSIPEFASNEPGYAISGVTQDSPADKAGLQGGDVIIQLGDSKVGNLEDFDSALRKHKGGDKVPVTVKRGEKEVTVTVTLEPPR